MPYQKNEIKMISDFSMQLSIVLIRVLEFDEINLKITLVKELMNITNSMMQTFNVERLENAFIHKIINVINAKRGFLIKKDKAENYYLAIAINNENILLKNPTNFNQSLISEVQQSKHSIYIENTPIEKNYKPNQFQLDNNTHSIYCAPIIINNEIFGVIYLDNFGNEDMYMKINMEMMDIFLTQFSLALSNVRTYQDLMAKNWELHTIDTMKNDFITIVSHELNTPLVTLQGYVKRLMKNMESIDTESKDLLTKVDKSTNRLISTINDILTLNRFNSKKELTKKLTNITESLNSVFNEIIYLSQSRKMKFKSEISDDLPMVVIDKKSFEILLLNLLMNAVRFTADYGNISLGARKAMFQHEKINDNDAVVIYVQDNGIGIPENEQENVFKAFYELGDIYSHRSSSMEFRSSGLGIGLAIAKRIVELHRGKIWLTSKEREGSTFFVSIPINL